MINLGKFPAGTIVFYGANFHSDQGTVEDPTTPTARHRTPGGVWSSLPNPAKQDAETGFYGGTVDTTGFSAGQRVIRLKGTVSTAKVVATLFAYTIEDQDDYKANVSGLSTFDPSDALDSGLSYDEILRIIGAGIAGTLTRSGNVLTFRAVDGTKIRITATVDANNNRLTVVVDGTP